MKIIRQIEVFAPDYLGKMDVLIAGGKILAVEEQLEGGYEGVEVEELSGEGKVLTPGFIDCHFHILGGGGRRLSKSNARSHIEPIDYSWCNDSCRLFGNRRRR